MESPILEPTGASGPDAALALMKEPVPLLQQLAYFCARYRIPREVLIQDWFVRTSVAAILFC